MQRARLEVRRGEGVDAGVDGARAEPRADAERQHRAEARRRRVAEQRRARRGAREREQCAHGHAGEQRAGEEARAHIAAHAGDEQRAERVERQPEALADTRPGDADRAVGQAEAREAEERERCQRQASARRAH